MARILKSGTIKGYSTIFVNNGAQFKLWLFGVVHKMLLRHRDEEISVVLKRE